MTGGLSIVRFSIDSSDFVTSGLEVGYIWHKSIKTRDTSTAISDTSTIINNNGVEQSSVTAWSSHITTQSYLCHNCWYSLIPWVLDRFPSFIWYNRHTLTYLIHIKCVITLNVWKIYRKCVTLTKIWCHSISKGAPARESRTGTRLVSPATGCQKKKKTPLEQGLRIQIEYIRNIIRSTDAMETGTAPGKPLKAESGWKKKEKKRNIPWRSFHIWTLFFLCHQSMPV